MEVHLHMGSMHSLNASSEVQSSCVKPREWQGYFRGNGKRIQVRALTNGRLHENAPCRISLLSWYSAQAIGLIHASSLAHAKLMLLYRDKAMSSILRIILTVSAASSIALVLTSSGCRTFSSAISFLTPPLLMLIPAFC